MCSASVAFAVSPALSGASEPAKSTRFPMRDARPLPDPSARYEMWTSPWAFPKATRHLSMSGATNVEPSPERSALSEGEPVGVDDVVEDDVVDEDDWDCDGGELLAQPASTRALPRSSVARTSFMWVSVP